MKQNQDHSNNQGIIVTLPVLEFLSVNISQAAHMTDFTIETLKLSSITLSQVLKQIESGGLKVNSKEYKGIKDQKKMVNLHITLLEEVFNRLTNHVCLNDLNRQENGEVKQ